MINFKNKDVTCEIKDESDGRWVRILNKNSLKWMKFKLDENNNIVSYSDYTGYLDGDTEVPLRYIVYGDEQEENVA